MTLTVPLIECTVQLDYGKLDWSGREDLNLRPPAPHAGTLPGCATPREAVIITESAGLESLTALCQCESQSSSCRARILANDRCADIRSEARLPRF